MIKALAFAALFYSTQALHNIKSFGAIPNKNDVETAFQNAKAFENAILKANASEHDREVYIPDGYTFNLMPTQV